MSTPARHEPSPAAEPDPQIARSWLTPGVWGIGIASFLADVGHEIPTALLPSFLASTLGASAAALGLVEGIADAAAGLARLAGGPLADDLLRRRATAIGGYTSTAVLAALLGLSMALWQVSLLRVAAWASRGIRVPARNADLVPPAVYGRAYGFERAMDNLGAIGGPVLALLLVGLVGVRTAMLLSVIPGVLAAGAIAYAIRHLQRDGGRPRQPLRLVIRPLLHGELRQLLLGIALFEAGHIAATLLILRATQLLTPALGAETATQVALGLYTAYNIAAAVASVPAGRLGDRRGPVVGLLLGVALFGLAYLSLAVPEAPLPLLIGGFIAAGVGIGCIETCQHAAIAAQAPPDLRGSAFGLLAAVQSFGNLVASSVAGVLWTAVSPTAAFLARALWTGLALGVLGRRLVTGGPHPADPA